MAQDIAIKIDDRYEVLEELGRGGMGIVYKANDLKMGRLVAIKVLTAQADGQDKYQERFLREAKSIAKMQHPNIVVVHDYGSHAGSPYMVMEYLEGIPLNKMIASRARLTPLVKVDYMLQVCHALYYAHQQGIIHRDVKPGNIMVLDGGKRVKIVDFGVARAGEASDLSKSGLAMGTTRYMSPEQIMGKKDLDARADIFSAGVVLYELLAGKPPWTGDADYEVMTKIIHEPFLPLSGAGDYPAILDRILERALAKERGARYPTAEGLSRDLIELEVPLKDQAVDQAMVQFENGDLLRANDLVSQILYIDTRHREAIQLRGKLQQVAQLQEWRAQVRQLRSTAEEAVDQQRYGDALSAVEQAANIDPANTELFHYREVVRNEAKRREDVRKKLQLAKRAQEINDLSTAQELVEKILEADPTDTEAQAMKTTLEQERKQQQLEEIAEEISDALEVHALARAAEFVQQLEGLNPSFALLASLKKRLAEAEAEEQRLKLEKEQVQAVLAQACEADLDSALEILTAARVKFPDSIEITEALEAVELASGKKDDEAEVEKAVEKTPEPQAAPAPAPSASSDTMAAAAKAPSPVASPGPSVAAPALRDQPRRAEQQKSARRKPWRGLAALAALVIVAVAGAIYLVHKARSSVSIKLHANVAGAAFTLDGRPTDPGNLSLVPGREYTIEASREGYRSDVKKVTAAATAGGSIEFVLNALAPKLLLSSDLTQGQVSLGGQQRVSLQSSDLAPEELSFGNTTLKVWDGQKILLELPLDVQPGKAVALAGSMQAHDCSVAVLSQLGHSARVYATPEVKGNSNTLPAQPIPPDGLAADVINAGTQFSLSDGRAWTLQPTNTPILTISLITGAVGTLQIQANAPEAELKIDKGPKSPMANGSKTVLLKAGKHQIQVVAPGYADSEVRGVDIVKGKTVNETFTLASRQAQLSLTGVEPGATLYVDGELQGTMPAGGSFKLAVSPGEHKVALKKQNYEDSPVIIREFKPKQPETITGKQLPLQKNGSLQFGVTPTTATITIRPPNGPARIVHANEPVFLPKGTYTWVIEAEHYQSVSDKADVQPSVSTYIAKGLQPAELGAADLFENPTLWSHRGDWWVFKHSGYGWLKIRNGSFNVIIEKRRKVEWTLDDRGEKDRIVYTVSGDTLSRQVISGGSSSKAPVKQFKEQSNIYQFIFDISPNRIVVRDNGNQVIDQFERPDPSVELGKIGFHGDISISVHWLR